MSRIKPFRQITRFGVHIGKILAIMSPLGMYEEVKIISIIKICYVNIY